MKHLEYFRTVLLSILALLIMTVTISAPASADDFSAPAAISTTIYSVPIPVSSITSASTTTMVDEIYAWTVTPKEIAGISVAITDMKKADYTLPSDSRRQHYGGQDRPAYLDMKIRPAILITDHVADIPQMQRI